jgi:hypothetical protein
MMSHGRLVEVCGTQVRRLYFKPLDPQFPHGSIDEGEPASTVAFSGLARRGQALWAVGSDGLYRFTEPRSPEFRPFPKFRNAGGYRISFDVPGIVLVMPDVNGPAFTSGAVPLMAVR